MHPSETGSKLDVAHPLSCTFVVLLLAAAAAAAAEARVVACPSPSPSPAVIAGGPPAGGSRLRQVCAASGAEVC